MVVSSLRSSRTRRELAGRGVRTAIVTTVLVLAGAMAFVGWLPPTAAAHSSSALSAVSASAAGSSDATAAQPQASPGPAAASPGGSSNAVGTLSVGGTLTWSLTPSATPTLVTVVCAAAWTTGITLSATYAGWGMWGAFANQQSNLYVAIFYLTYPVSGTQTAAVTLVSAATAPVLECSATAWTGPTSIDASIASTSSEFGSTQLYVSIAPKTTVPSNEVFFSGLNLFEWSNNGAGTALTVTGSGATPSIVDAERCQPVPSHSDVDCIASAKLPTGGTSMTYSWASYGGYAVLVGFGIRSTPITVSGWKGWDGNGVIYMTTGISSTTPYVIATSSAGNQETDTISGASLPNGARVASGQATTTSSTDYAYEFDEASWGSPNNYLEVNMPIVAGGGDSVTAMPWPANPGEWTFFQVGWQKLGLSASNAPPDLYEEVQTGMNSGVNVSGGTPPYAPSQLQQFAWETWCTAPWMTWGCYVISVWQIVDTMTTAPTSNLYSYGGQPAYAIFPISGGNPSPSTVPNTATQAIVGQNSFASQTMLTVKIPSGDFMSYLPVFTVSAQNLLEAWDYIRGTGNVGIVAQAPGYTASLTVAAVPAVTLTGTIYKNGQGDANQAFSLTGSNGVVYQLTTDSGGHYQFFAAPDTTYTISAALPSSWPNTQATSSTTTPNAATVASLDLTIPTPSIIQGTVTNANTGAAIYNAQVNIAEPYPPGATIGPTTNSYGVYSVTAGMLGTYSFNVGATGYNSASGSLSVSAWGTTYTKYFALTPTSGGGGGGCILSGTPIALAGGGTKAVNKLRVGDAVLGYDTTTGAWVPETVTQDSFSFVNRALSIDNGLLVTTLTDQPLYVQNGTWTGWVHDPQNLSLGEQLFVPSTGAWVRVASLQVLTGNFKVYDLRVTAPNNYVANGVLVGDKPRPQ